MTPANSVGKMPEHDFSDEKLKVLLKAAVIEALEEKREFVRDLIEEALEDIAMVHAIEEGATAKTIEPGEVYTILESKP